MLIIRLNSYLFKLRDRICPGVTTISDLGARLEVYRRRHALTEHGLAKVLKTSQPTVHRLLKGEGNRRQRLVLTAEALLAVEVSQLGRDEWLASVAKAAESSGSFRAMVDAGLALVNRNE